MAVICPGVFYGNKPVEEEREKAEVLAKAFHLTSKRYFKRRKELNDAIADARELVGDGNDNIKQGRGQKEDGRRLIEEGTKERNEGRKQKALAKKIYGILGGIIGVLLITSIILASVRSVRDVMTGTGICGLFFGVGLFSITFLIPYNKNKKADEMIKRGTTRIQSGDDLMEKGNHNINKGENKVEDGKNTIARSDSQLSGLKPEKKISLVAKVFFPFLIPRGQWFLMAWGLASPKSSI